LKVISRLTWTNKQNSWLSMHAPNNNPSVLWQLSEKWQKKIKIAEENSQRQKSEASQLKKKW
jgi:hypothetical protein